MNDQSRTAFTAAWRFLVDCIWNIFALGLTYKNFTLYLTASESTILIADFAHLRIRIEMTNNLFRFILFAPVSFVIYYLTRTSVSVAFTLLDPEMVEVVHKQVGFHNYLSGPIFVLLENGLSIAFMVFTGVTIVPRFKKGVFYGYLTLWIVMLIFVSFMAGLACRTIVWSTEMLLMNVLLVVSQGVAFLLVSRALWSDTAAKELDGNEA